MMDIAPKVDSDFLDGAIAAYPTQTHPSSTQ